MTVLPKSNLRVISFKTALANSDGEAITGFEREHNLIFNITHITEAEVHILIRDDAYELDDRVIDVSNKELEYLFDKEG